MINKDAFWFPHDCNARNDPKISAMRSVWGSEGYGWYWMLIEILREQKNYKISICNKFDINALALQLNTESEKLKEFIDNCVNDFLDGDNKGLFSQDDQFLWSDSLLRRMQRKDLIAKKRSKAGKKSGQVRQGMIFDEQTMNNCSSFVEQNGTIIKEKKIEEDIIEENNIREKKIKKRLIINRTSQIVLDYLSDKSEEVTIAFDEFWEMRKRLKKPIETERTFNKIIKDLNEHSNNRENIMIELLNQSTDNRWQGIFPLKDNNGNSKYKQKSAFERNLEELGVPL